VDRSGPSGDRHRQSAASLTDSDPLKVCLQRTVELDNVRLRLRDWPGFAGPLVHLPDPLAPSSFIDALAALLAPKFRVVSLSLRDDAPCQVDVVDTMAVFDQFGFETPVLVGERAGCLAALLVAVWYPTRVGGLVLVDATYAPPSGESLAARALRDCPPNWADLRAAIRCPVCEANSAEDVRRFVVQLP
jgi:pimeloyl-ACP methyl ester carboxylesterase